MFGNVYLIEDLGDLPVFIDEERLSSGSHVLLPVHALFTPDAVVANDLLIGIGDQRVGKTEFRDELLMRLFVVNRNSDHPNVLCLVFVVRVTERARFLRSARRIVLRIEPQDHPLAFQVGKPDGVAVLVFRGKIRCLIAFFQHNCRMIVKSCGPGKTAAASNDCSTRAGSK